MKVLLFGGSGQLGFEILKRGYDLNFDIVAPVISEIDVSEKEQVRYLASQVKPEVILNCAAYTAVDKAEEEKEEAYRINSNGASNVAEVAAELGSYLIHISTDYVFNGTQTAPIKEDAPTEPLNVYGASKLAGEQQVKKYANTLIVRTSSLHGQRGINFVHTMLRLFREQDVIKVVDDQWMSPTWAGWLSEVVLDLCRIRYTGTLHATGSGVISWYDFALAVFKFAKNGLEGRDHVRIEPIKSAQLSRPARRPVYSALDCSLLTKVLGREPISWEKGLKEHLKELDLSV